MIGTHVVQLGDAALDITCLCDQVAIKHGRDDTSSQPEASTATVDMSLDTGETDLPPGLELGQLVTVRTITPSTNSVRFRGTITDISSGWDDLGPDTPEALVLQIIATGDLGNLGRRVIGDVPWPQELDGARITRIMNEADVTLDPAHSDPGVSQILARDVDAQPALELARSVADSASGIVWQTRTGEVRYADSQHRRGTTASLRLDSCDLLVSPVWQRNTDGLINKVSIQYGVAPEGGEQPTIADRNQPSIDQWGRHDVSQSTELATLQDATNLSRLLLTRNAWPVWILSALPVSVADLDEARTTALLGLEINDLLEVVGLPYAGTAPTATSLWIEGWAETLRFGEHELTLAVSGYCRTVPPPRWDDVTPATTWNDVSASLRWDDAYCLGPQVTFGRWNDVAATTRWDHLTPDQTWNTFTGAVIPNAELVGA